MSDEAADFVIKSVAMVAEHGWKLLPQVKTLCQKVDVKYLIRYDKLPGCNGGHGQVLSFARMKCQLYCGFMD